MKKLWLFFLLIGLTVGFLAVVFSWPRMMPNLLMEQSNSAYLNQHKHDYVRWQPWDKSIFQQTKDQEKLLFISIGFATCYWCHFMQEDSFNDFFLARYINDHYIPILIDKEQHFDINRIYMNAVVYEKGAAGWPMTIIATPEGVPIYFGLTVHRDDLMLVLKTYYNQWVDNPQAVRNAANDWLGEYGTYSSKKVNRSVSVDFLPKLKVWVRDHIDPIFGGLKGSQKFPNAYRWSQLISFFPEYTVYLKQMVDSILTSPMYDSIDGGIHRYSSDKMWLIPHYEKLLVDQVYFVHLLLSLYDEYRDPLYLDYAQLTIQFVHHHLQTDDGLFMTGLDAGHVGKEGAYYQVNQRMHTTYSSGLDFISKGKGRGLVFLNDLTNMDLINRVAYQNIRRSDRKFPEQDTFVSVSNNAKLLVALNRYQRISIDQSYQDSINRILSFLLDRPLLPLREALIVYDAFKRVDYTNDLTRIEQSIHNKLTPSFPFFTAIDYLPSQLVEHSFDDDYDGPQMLYYLMKYSEFGVAVLDDHQCEELASLINDSWTQISLVKIYHTNCL